MRNKNRFKTRIPPMIKTHKLFGHKYVNQHLIEDDRWTPMVLGNQYKCIVDFLTRNNEIQQLEYKIKEKKQKKQIAYYSQKIHKGNEEIKQIDFASGERIQSILGNYKDLLKLCQILPRDKALEKVKQHEFEKRKENDKLHYEMKKLSKQYEQKLIDISKLDDKIKFPEAITGGEKEILKIHKKLKTIEVQLRAINTIKRTYLDVIKILYHDAIYYNTVLDALQDDIKDQKNFIEHIIHLGKPKIAELPLLTHKYIRMEEEQMKFIYRKIEKFKAYKEKIETYYKEIYKQEHREESNKNYRADYKFETPTINNLRNELLNYEAVFKKLKHASHSLTLKDVVKTIKSQKKNIVGMRLIIDLNESEERLIQQKETVSEQVQEFLKSNLTTEEISCFAKIHKIENKIEAEKAAQKVIQNYIAEKGKVSVHLAWALYHIINTLDDFGGIKPFSKNRPYQSEDLKLPLLNFANYKNYKKPPPSYENDLPRLLEVAKSKFDGLMNAFKGVPHHTVDEAKKQFHNQFKNNFKLKMFKSKLLFDEASIKTDRNLLHGQGDFEVLTREKLKRESLKILKANLNEENN